ncbi:MAG: MerC family mercury resistance protein [Gammaproteobacteria bacterium]
MIKKFTSIDYAGIAIASICFMHCLGSFLILAGYTTSSFIYLNFLDDPKMHFGFIILSVSLGVISLLVAYLVLKKSSEVSNFINLVLGLGISFLLAGLILDVLTTSNLANILLITGAGAIITLHFELLRVKRKIID